MERYIVKDVMHHVTKKIVYRVYDTKNRVLSQSYYLSWEICNSIVEVKNKLYNKVH